MADQWYIDTASVGGDGTTTGLSGATAAFESVAVAEDTVEKDLTSGDGIQTFDGNGSAADTDPDGWLFAGASGWQTNSTNYVIFQGGSQSAGRYKGPLAYSTSHYRLEQQAGGSRKVAFQMNIDMILRGVQIMNQWDGVTGAQIVFLEDSASEPGSPAFYTVEYCRLIDNNTASAAGAGILNNQSHAHQTTIRGNIIQSIGTSTSVQISMFQETGADIDIYNNILDGRNAAGSANATKNINIINLVDGTVRLYNNVMWGHTLNSVDFGSGQTEIWANNASEEDLSSPSGTTPSGFVHIDGVTNTLANMMQDPTNSTPASRDYRGLSSGALSEAGSATLQTATDIAAASWVNNDIGAFNITSGLGAPLISGSSLIVAPDGSPLRLPS